MMTTGLRPFGLISTTVWQSERFTNLNSLDTRLAYLWLHTSAKTCAGVLRIGPAHLLEEVDYVPTLERASEIFTELVNARLIQWVRPFVVIQNYSRFNPVKSYRHAIGAFKEALALPDSDAKHAVICELKRQPGAMDLAKWRNKAGEPHEVLFAIEAYLNADNLNPSETPNEPIGNPSGINRSRNINEKGEGRTPPESDFPYSPAPNDAQAETADLPRNGEIPEGSSFAKPTDATKRSALVVNMREAV